MNRQDDAGGGLPGVDPDPPAPLASLVAALLGRRVRDLRVEVRAGGLVLHGRAASYHAKQLAQHAAMAVTDLPLVANRIEVTNPRREPTEGRVLLATDDDRLRSAGHDRLTAQGYVVATAGGGVECVALLREFAPDVVVLDTDLHWGGADGVLDHLRAGDGPGVPTVLLTNRFAAPPGSESGGGPPPVWVLEKPLAAEALLRAVRAAVGGGSAARSGRRPAAGEEAPPPPA